MLLGDRYRIEKELGRGGVGIVYLARDEHLLSRPVVIKLLLEESNPDPWLQKKFRQEIEALARIDHPGVVGALDCGETPDGKPYLVMQFVEGVTLRSVIGERGMDLGRVASILHQVGQALGAAHEKGVYHRDLKPENIMLQRLADGEEHVKLIDFGIATVKDSQVASGVQTTKVAGSFAYMAPEQFRGQASAASDIYSLGVIAYEMVTGRRPFPPDSLYQLLEAQQQGVPVKPLVLRPDLPELAQQVILKALSFDPESRYPRAREFGEELARALQEKAAPSAPHASTPPRLEMAHVLFMDLVGYSTRPLDQQTAMLHELQQIVRSTREFRQAAGQLLSLPTGDGMALVFFSSPEAPVECAIEIGRAVREHPQLQLRMGVHAGPVYRIPDINTNLNVAGGGINLAQRVMDCGDAGHILVSKPVADILSQLTKWARCLEDFGEHAVKHGERIHLYNLRSENVGNPVWPQRLRPPKRKKKWRVPVLAAVAAVGLIAFAIWWWPSSRPLGPAPDVKLTRPGTELKQPPQELAKASRVPPRDPVSKASPLPVPAEPLPERDLRAGRAVRQPSPPDWPTFRGNAQRNGVTGVMGPRRPRILWVVNVGGQLRGSPVIGSDGTVYIGSVDGNLYLIRNREVAGTVPTGGIILGTPVIESDGVVHVTTSSGERYSLDPTGRKLGISRGRSEETARSPDGHAYYAEGSMLKVVDDETWRVDLGVAASTSLAVGNNGDIYVGTADGTLYCIDRHAKTRWTYRAAAKVTAAPAIKDDGDVIFGCGDRNLYCLRNGELRWKFATGGPILSAPIVDRSGTIYFGSNDGNLYAVTDLGDLVWKLPLGNEIHASPAFDRQGRLYIATLSRQIYCISD